MSTGQTAQTVQAELQKLLERSGLPVADLLKKFDVDADRTMLIDEMEFYCAMRHHFGYTGPFSVIAQVFQSLDGDGSGMIGFDELYEFVRGKRHSLDHRQHHRQHDRVHELPQEMQMLPGPEPSMEQAGRRLGEEAGGCWPSSLEQIQWSEDVLRKMLQQMLTRYSVGAVHLIRAWGGDGNRQISEPCFLCGLGDFFSACPKLWQCEVEPLARAAFRRMAKTSSRDRLIQVWKLS